MWAFLNACSHYSLLRSICKPKDIIKRVSDVGIHSVALTDINNISGCVDFVKAASKANVNWILGNNLLLKEGLCIVLAKNLPGWKSLIKTTSLNNKSQLSVLDLSNLNNDNWFIITGFPQSSLANEIFINPDLSQHIIDKYKCCFSNLYFASQLNSPQGQFLSNLYRQNNCKTIATIESYYIDKEDAVNHRIIISKALKQTFKNIDKSSNKFFQSSDYYIPSCEEITQSYKDRPNELENTIEIASQCTKYNIFSKPDFPIFDTKEIPNKDYLRNLCIDGWNSLTDHFSPAQKNLYGQRVKNELTVLNSANLSGYLLVVQDYVRWAKSQGCLVNLRGSGAGSLVCHLIGISDIDPIRYDLIFERFYNAGRNTAERVALPDLDVDFPTGWKNKVLNYIRDRYGNSKVSQMITFHRMQGRAALRDVLRAYGTFSFDDINHITKDIPDEATISDKLQEMKESGNDPSIIMWCLENISKKLVDFCQIIDSEIVGPMGRYFRQAIDLEGTKVIKSKHAAGTIISNSSLEDNCPVEYDENNLVASIEMEGLEEMGYIKFDILGVNALDKIMEVTNLIKLKG